MRANIVFCGQLGSGKTKVSKGVAEALGARWGSFSQTIKRIASEKNIPIQRDKLQALGEELVLNSPRSLCERVLSEAEPNTDTDAIIVIDGLRHAHIYDVLSALSKPRMLYCVFVEVQDSIRIKRVRSRDGITEETIRKAEAHSTEIQVAQTLRSTSHFVVDNSFSPEKAIANVISWLELRR